MVEWIKWWKDKTFLMVLTIALFAMLVAFIFAKCIEWGWILSCATALIAGFSIRKIVVKKLDNLDNNA